MILTVTPNPAFDYTIRLDELEIGRRAKYRDPLIEPTGKGINVSRMVRRLGEPTFALGFSAGLTGDLLKQGLDREGVPHDLVEIPGLTRINVTLLTGPEGSATHLHGPGPGVSSEDLLRLRERLTAHLARARILLLSGSLPPGMSPAAAVDLLRDARGVRTIVDAEGELLAAAVDARVDLVKPNLFEAGQFLGRELSGVEAAATAARDIVARGAGTAVITLRGEGAVASNAGRCWHVRAPREEVVRAIGAGDSFAAGLAVALSRGADLPEALRHAAAAGAAAALHSGTGLGNPDEVARLLKLTELRELA